MLPRGPINVLGHPGEAVSFPLHGSTLSGFSVYDGHFAPSSVLAVARADGSLVVFRQGFRQVASLTRRQIPIANRRYDQPSDDAVRVHYGLLNRCRVCSIGYIQF